MRRFIQFVCFTLLLFMFACTATQQNGDLRVTPSPLLVGNVWGISQQSALSNGDRICTIAASELEITQRSHEGHILLQVATGTKLNIGDSYKVLVGQHNYETTTGLFNYSQSTSIINHMKNESIVYTEMQIRDVNFLSRYHREPNKIKLDDFGSTYASCTRYVSGG